MSTLTLVRHGQAEVFQRESAALSPVGELQARALGEWWLRHGVTFDEVYCGALPRQARTAEVVADCYRAAGQRWPDAMRTPHGTNTTLPAYCEASCRRIRA